MTPMGRQPTSPVPTAMICAAAITAQFIAGKATRDALYLARLDATSLPLMVVATSLVSIALVLASAKVLRRVAPATFVPWAFAISSLLLLGEWGLTFVAPTAAAIVVYLHISGLGPMLGSGFWLIATERFDPRTAKRTFGQIAGIGTLGGLFGALLAERVAAVASIASMLPLLAAIGAVCAWQVTRLARATQAPRPSTPEVSPELAAAPGMSGLRALANEPYLRHLAALVLLGTVAGGLVDYLFKVQAVASFGNGHTLLRFFAIYYAAISLVTFALQTSSTRIALERLGLTLTTGSPAIALLIGCVGALFAPGLEGTIAARSGEAVFRGSWFRSAYELFYTPIPAHEKRAAKSIIDVAFDRLGDAFGGGLVRVLLLLPLATQRTAILSAAVACSAASLVVASRLKRGYVKTLERSLHHRAIELELSDLQDRTTQETFARTMTLLRPVRPMPGRAEAARPPLDTPQPAAPAARPSTPASMVRDPDPDILQMRVLRSLDPPAIRTVLKTEPRIPATLVPHVIPLLAWDPVCNEAGTALRRVAEEHVGQYIDALIDPNQPFAVRRRLARVFSVCVSQRAADGLLYGLDDPRFEVRFQCGRSLAAIVDKNPRIRIDRDRVLDVVRLETSVNERVWKSERLLQGMEDRERKSFTDDLVTDRANRSLAHVFTLLALALPSEAPGLKVAFRGLQTDDAKMRGTAVEYLETILPVDIRRRLLPFLEEPRTAPGERPERSREEVLAELLQSNGSITLNLETLQRLRGSEPVAPKDKWQAT